MKNILNTKKIHVTINNSSVRSAENYVRMVGIGDLLGMILIGPAGMGKTHTVEHILDDMGIEYVKYGGHITLAAVYGFLFENANKLIFFDDCSNIVNNTEIMELLKQALQISNKQRILHYRSFGTRTGAPASFAFEGRIIMAFNKMDVNNANVKAIVDRAPCIELKYAREEIYKAMFQVAEGDGNGLKEYEKLIVTQEIENYTRQDPTLEISLRQQQVAFQVYDSFKRLFGEGNSDWKIEVCKIFGKTKESWMREIIRDMVGEATISRKELANAIALKKNMSPRNAHRKINEYLESEDIYQDKLKGGSISLKPFK